HAACGDSAAFRQRASFLLVHARPPQEQIERALAAMLWAGVFEAQHLIAQVCLVEPKRHLPTKHPAFSETAALPRDDENAAPPHRRRLPHETLQGEVCIALVQAVQVEARLNRQAPTPQPLSPPLVHSL